MRDLNSFFFFFSEKFVCKVCRDGVFKGGEVGRKRCWSFSRNRDSSSGEINVARHGRKEILCCVNLLLKRKTIWKRETTIIGDQRRNSFVRAWYVEQSETQPRSLSGENNLELNRKGFLLNA